MTYAMPHQPVRRGKPWLLIIGAVLLLASLALCGIGGFTTLAKGKEITDSPEYTGSHVVQIDAGDSVAVWSTDDLASCTAVGPGGPISDSGGASQTVTWGETELERVMLVEADQSGEHTITCTSPFHLGDDLSMGGFAALGIGSLLCCLSGVLVVIGFVLWLMKRRS